MKTNEHDERNIESLTKLLATIDKLYLTRSGFPQYEYSIEARWIWDAYEMDSNQTIRTLVEGTFARCFALDFTGEFTAKELIQIELILKRKFAKW